MNPRISDADLHAYVDGELDPRAHAEMEELLRADPAQLARAEAFLRQNEALHTLFDAVANEPVPAHLSALIMRPRRRVIQPRFMRIAAAVLLSLLIGAAGGWGLRGLQDVPITDSTPTYVARAVGAHLVYAAEIRHPVEVAANREDHLVAWLSKRLGNPLRAPSLTAAGYMLVGGRLLEDSGRPAAQFMYEDESGHRITVYLRSYAGQDSAFKFFNDGEIAAFYWIDAPFAYALTGDMPRDELLRIAHRVYEDLTP